MKITLLCNAGLSFESNGKVLLVDLPNGAEEPFYRLPEQVWHEICEGSAPYDNICGFWFTHDHPDHLDRLRLEQFSKEVPVFIAGDKEEHGKVTIGDFTVKYKVIPHAPLPNPPRHVASLIEADDVSVYLPADAALDCEAHDGFLNGFVADIGIWNSMYLSKAETRALMKRSAKRNYIYHMPLKPDRYGMWRKCEKNFERYAEELSGVTVLENYPSYL